MVDVTRKDTFVITEKKRFVINGREYQSWEEVPEADRKRLQSMGETLSHALPAGMEGGDALVKAFTEGGPSVAPFAPGDEDARRALTATRLVVLVLLGVIAYLLATR